MEKKENEKGGEVLSDPIIQRERADLDLYLFLNGYKIVEDYSGKDCFCFKIKKRRR